MSASMASASFKYSDFDIIAPSALFRLHRGKDRRICSYTIPIAPGKSKVQRFRRSRQGATGAFANGVALPRATKGDENVRNLFNHVPAGELALSALRYRLELDPAALCRARRDCPPLWA